MFCLVCTKYNILPSIVLENTEIRKLLIADFNNSNLKEIENIILSEENNEEL